MLQITWLGHATWMVESDRNRVLVDPFLDENPAATVKAADLDPPDTILVSHGHSDHIADAAAIAKRAGSHVIANFEIGEWLKSRHRLEKVTGMNLGGRLETDFGWVKMTLAWHSSSLPDGTYGGNPGGFVVSIGGRKIWFAADTALFADMQLIGRQGIDLAVLPIGDLFTMGVEDSVEATRLVGPGKVAPTHYNTWPPIRQDAAAWAERIRAETDAEPVVPQVGQPFTI